MPAHVTEAKFTEQLNRWHANAETYARRGWVLLSSGDLCVEIGFLQNVALGGRVIPVMTACVRLDYWNFDLWPPALTFLDPLTREPAPPPVRAPDRVSPSEVRDALIDQHPVTLQPFLCLAGIREYHTHPQHSGDDWLLHRHLREGDLVVVCERIWRRMARNVLGMSVAIQSLAPANNAIATQLEINLLQGDADLAQRQLADQHPDFIPPVPTPEPLPVLGSGVDPTLGDAVEPVSAAGLPSEVDPAPDLAAQATPEPAPVPASDATADLAPDARLNGISEPTGATADNGRPQEALGQDGAVAQPASARGTSGSEDGPWT